MRVPPGPAGARSHVGRIDLVEVEDHHDMGEGVETGHRVGPEPCTVEADHGMHPAPVVIDRLGPATDDDSDGLQRDHDGQR